jgi:biotin transport system substrate-specific component
MQATQTLSIPRGRALARDAVLVGGFAALTALAAKVAIPLPWTPVPATLQVAAVMLAGAVAGPWRGALSQILVLALGFCGLPVFADSTMAGPAVVMLASFGYLLAFPVAAWLAGRWTGKASRWLGAGAGLLVIYLLGSLWLVGWTLLSGQPATLGWTLWAGVLPFLPLDLLKTALAMGSAIPLRRRLG